MTERELLEQGLRALIPDFSPQTVDKLLGFSSLLLEKNRVMNLTAVTDPCEVVTRHLLDCAALAPYLGDARRVIDVGTGAGFPGLPLAVLLPDVSFVLLDAQRKRVDFLCEAAAALGLSNVEPVHARAEEYARAHREDFDLAVSRAVAPLRELCELALPMVRVGGAFLAMKAADCADEIAAASRAFTVLGAPAVEPLCYTVPFAAVERTVVRLRKTAPTPTQYPRRFKKIQTQPL